MKQHKIFFLIVITFFLLTLCIPINIGITLFHPQNPTSIDTNPCQNRQKYWEHILPEKYPIHTNSNTQIKPDTSQQTTKKIERQTNLKMNNQFESVWPMYCHDTHHTGFSPYSTEENPLTEKWRFPVSWSSFYTGVILDSNGIIYGGPDYIYAIYPNGTEKWRFNTNNPIESNPVIDDNGILYVGTIWGMPNYLHAIYSNNGTQKWTYAVGPDIDSSPVIGSDGTIYFGDWAGYLHAVYPNGAMRWKYYLGSVITSSPAIDNEGIIYIGSHNNNLYALYPDGALKWQFNTSSWIHGSPTIAPDGTIYIGSDDGYLYALNPENGSMIWNCPVGYTWCSPAIGPDGTLYLGTFNMIFYAINPNGTIKWSYNAPGRIWFGSSASISSDGTIFFGTTTMDGGSGAFIALNPNGTKRYENNYCFFATSPAIAEDGTVYALSFNYEGMCGVLHAFGSGEPKKIEITKPEPSSLYLFGVRIGSLPQEKILALGSVNIQVRAYSESELQRIDFAVDGTVQFSDTEPPFEWRMNKRYSDWPFWGHTLSVIGYYKGGCTWTDSIDILYIHLRHNYPN